MGSVDLQSSYMINLLGNTFVKSSLHLRYFDSNFTLTCTFLAVYEVKDTWPLAST